MACVLDPEQGGAEHLRVRLFVPNSHDWEHWLQEPQPPHLLTNYRNEENNSEHSSRDCFELSTKNKIPNLIFFMCLPHMLQDLRQCSLTFLFLSFDLIFLTQFAFPALIHRLEHLPLLASLEQVRPHLTPLGSFLSLHARKN